MLYPHFDLFWGNLGHRFFTQFLNHCTFLWVRFKNVLLSFITFTRCTRISLRLELFPSGTRYSFHVCIWWYISIAQNFRFQVFVVKVLCGLLFLYSSFTISSNFFATCPRMKWFHPISCCVRVKFFIFFCYFEALVTYYGIHKILSDYVLLSVLMNLVYWFFCKSDVILFSLSWWWRWFWLQQYGG